MVLGVFWLLFALATILDASWSIYLFFASLSFGSLAILPPSVTGGTTFLPLTACSFLLSVKAFFKVGRPVLAIDGLLGANRLGLLTAFILCSLIVTFTAPILFAGVPVMGLNSGARSALAFGSGNITQPLYLMASYLVTVSMYQLLLDEASRQVVFRAIMIGGAIAVFAGMLDMATANTTILAPLRTATYQLMNDNQVGNVRRVIGFNTEASGYGALTLSYLSLIYFMRIGKAVGGLFAIIELPLVLLLLAFVLLSTSSAAYLGAIVFVVFAIVNNVTAQPASEERGRATFELLVIIAGVLIAAALYAIKPSLFTGVFDMLDRVLFTKTASDSYAERSNWNIVSLEGFRATVGYGVGIGSTRASSWPVIVLSSCGIVGAALMVALFARLCTLPLAGADPTLRRIVAGARYALFVCAVPGFAAGTLVDFGAFNATLFAIAAAMPCLINPPRWMHLSPYSASSAAKGTIGPR